MLVVQDAERGGLERVVTTRFGGLTEPACGEHPKHVSVGEDQRVPLRRADLGNHPIGAAADIGRCLAAGSTVAPE